MLDLSKATAQEVFDYVANHLLKQNKKATRIMEGSECAYRGVGGLKCAAGCLLKDEDYVPSLEGKSWNYIATNINGYSAHNTLISALQRVHDNYDHINWPRALKELSIRQGLIFRV